MKNPLDPTLQDLREWAYGDNPSEPDQDWDLLFAMSPDESFFQTIVEIGVDRSNCPKWRYFMDLLYLIFQCAVERNLFETSSKPYLRLLDLARGTDDPYLKTWRHRSLMVIQSPDSYEKTAWYANRYSFETNE